MPDTFLSGPDQLSPMLRRFRETGPAFLVPLAWAFVAAAHLDYVGLYPVQVAHGVMVVLLGLFAATGWREMDEGVLLAWRSIIVAGFGITLLGLLVLVVAPNVALPLSAVVVGWMLLPAGGLLYTAQAVEDAPQPYLFGGAASVAGGLLYAVSVLLALGTTSLVAGLGMAGVGQTMGIVAAVTQYRPAATGATQGR
jgi:hypothetical protein